jgi:hypothetical protein
MNRNLYLAATAVVSALFLSGCAAGTASVPTPAVTVTQYVPQYVPQQQQQYQAPDPVVPEYEDPAPQAPAPVFPQYVAPDPAPAIDQFACFRAKSDAEATASKIESTARQIDDSTREGRNQRYDLEQQARSIRSNAVSAYLDCISP